MAPPAANSTALATSLSSICAMRSGAPSTITPSRGRRERDARVRIHEAEAVDAAARPPARGRTLTRSTSDKLCSRRAASVMRVRMLREPRQPLLRTPHVDARVARQRRRLEVVERAAHDRDRRAQFVRQPARHVLLIARVRGESRQHAAEAARQVADLVACAGARERRTDAPLLVDRALRIVAQAPDARRQPCRVGGQREGAHEQHGQHDVEKALERAVALGEHGVAGLLRDDDAAHLVAAPTPDAPR